MSKTRTGWDAALEWAARMIETGYPAGSAPPSPSALAMTLRARKGDVDLQLTGEAVATQVFESKRRGAARSGGPAKFIDPHGEISTAPTGDKYV